jgi:hypothetical protein
MATSQVQLQFEYSCCAQVCVRILDGKQGYSASMIVDARILAHTLDG